MNNLPQSSSVYYGRVFAEAFTQAAGEESFRNALT
jgi:hypothetical protein